MQGAAASSSYLCLSTLEPAEATMAALARMQPELLFSTSSYLEVMVHNLPQRALAQIHPKVVVYMSQALHARVKQTLESLWGCEIFGLYGTAEAQLLGYECIDHSGYHVLEGTCAVRVVDEQGHDVGVGQQGEVVVSNLFNRAMVLLNYRQGDLAVKGDACPCGCPLLKLSSIEGRTTDMIMLPGGRAVNLRGAVTRCADQEPDIRQIQVVQRARDAIAVQIVTKSDPTEDLKDRVASYLQHFLGNDVRVTVERVDEIVPEPGSTKVRQIIPMRQEENAAGRHCG